MLGGALKYFERRNGGIWCDLKTATPRKPNLASNYIEDPISYLSSIHYDTLSRSEKVI